MSSSTPSIAATEVGQKITFLSKNATDLIVYEGTLEGWVSPTLAQQYSDIVSYNAAVRLSDTTVSVNVTTLNFFVISLTNNTGPVQRYAFAVEWIVSGSFAVIDPLTKVNVVVYDSPGADPTSILTVLRAAGYKCYIP